MDDGHEVEDGPMPGAIDMWFAIAEVAVVLGMRSPDFSDAAKEKLAALQRRLSTGEPLIAEDVKELIKLFAFLQGDMVNTTVMWTQLFAGLTHEELAALSPGTRAVVEDARRIFGQSSP